MFRNHIIIEHNEKNFIYIPQTNKILETESEMVELLKSKTMEELQSKIEDSKYRYDEVVNELHNINLFEEDKINVENQSEKLKLHTLVLSIIQNCNLNCKYCFAEGGKYSHSGTMSFEKAKGAINFLLDNSGDETLSIIFFGGEPLLNMSLIKQVVDYCEENAKKWGKEISFSMTTNATLITKEVADYLAQHDIHVQVSIDGKKEVNDANRYDKKNQGAYKKIINGINNLSPKHYKSARGTMTNKGCDIDEAVEHLISLGFSSVFMAPAYNLLSSDSIEKILGSYDRLFERYNKLLDERNFIECNKIKNVNNMLWYIHSAKVLKKNCGASLFELAVDIDGNIYPCQRFIGQQNFCLGNISDKESINRIDMFRQSISPMGANCNDCIAAGVCGGGCINENYTQSGNINAMAKVNCKIMRKVVEKSLETYIRMDDEAKEKIIV